MSMNRKRYNTEALRRLRKEMDSLDRKMERLVKWLIRVLIAGLPVMIYTYFRLESSNQPMTEFELKLSIYCLIVGGIGIVMFTILSLMSYEYGELEKEYDFYLNNRGY